MIKRFSAALLCIILSAVFVFPPAPANAAVAVRYRGSGTEADPYLISSADELYMLASSVNSGNTREGEHFLLTSDIVLNDVSDFESWSTVNAPENIWVPIGDALITDGFEDGRYFAGSFDGGGHSITGAYVRASAGLNGAGLFGIIRGGSVKNLALQSFFIQENADRCGGIAGRAYGTAFENCTVEGVVNGSRASGGIVGELSDGSIAGCTATVRVLCPIGAGGIVGSCANSILTDCGASGTVSADNYAGGIAGIADGSGFSSCASECAVSSAERVGAIAGFCYNTSFSDCAGGGSVTGADYCGGIVGLCQNAELLRCRSNALIECERYGGGAAGMCCSTLISAFLNEGGVSGEYYIGGVAGWSHNGNDFGSIRQDVRAYDYGAVITQCANEGRISGEWGIGGIVGDCHETEIYDCYNSGETVSIEYAGGIAGYTADSVIEHCYNAGAVTAGYAVDALIGRNSMDTTAVRDCFYLNTSCADPSEHGEARTHEELMLEESYGGFDFTSVWMLDDGTDYPYAELRALNTAASPLPGDIDGNGSVSVSDALLALRAAMGIVELSSAQLTAADIDGSGEVTAADAVIVLMLALGIDSPRCAVPVFARAPCAANAY